MGVEMLKEVVNELHRVAILVIYHSFMVALCCKVITSKKFVKENHINAANITVRVYLGKETR